ncbi:MAG: alpha/beta hydrolase [Phycisphaeraceae bacterium]
MATLPSRTNLLLTLTTAALLTGLAPTTAAQTDRPNRDNAIELPENENRDNRDSRWRIPDDATSENNRMLERILQRYPEADTDKDGKLVAQEARDFIEKQRERWRERGNSRRNRLEPTFDDIKYGPEDKHHFDLYRAETEDPAPLVVFFHGGQFITGDETRFRPFDISGLLQAGISVASIDYRETNDAPFPGPFDDAQMAIQFIRFYAEQLNIDPTRIAGLGDEAGGNITLYLALHDDMFDQETRNSLEEGSIEDPRLKLPEGPINLPEPKQEQEQQTPEPDEQEDTEEPGQEEGQELEQEQRQAEEKIDSLDDIVLENLIPWDAEAIGAASTKLKAAVALHPIATFDPREWEKRGLPMNDHERMMTKYLDVRYLEPLNDEEVIKVVERVSPLSLVSGDDPPLLLISLYEDLPLPDNTVWTIMRHHPKQSQLIGGALRAKGGEAIIRYKGMRNAPEIRSTDFLIEKLK